MNCSVQAWILLATTLANSFDPTDKRVIPLQVDLSSLDPFLFHSGITIPVCQDSGHFAPSSPKFPPFVVLGQHRGFVHYFVPGRPAGSLPAGRPAGSLASRPAGRFHVARPAGQHRVRRPAGQTGWLAGWLAG